MYVEKLKYTRNDPLWVYEWLMLDEDDALRWLDIDLGLSRFKGNGHQFPAQGWGVLLGTDGGYAATLADREIDAIISALQELRDECRRRNGELALNQT